MVVKRKLVKIMVVLRILEERKLELMEGLEIIGRGLW